MLYHLLYERFGEISLFNVFRYITFRTLMAIISAFFFTMVVEKWFITRLTARRIGQEIRSDGPQSHQVKKGTPTMGGLMVLIAIILTVIFWTNFDNKLIWLSLYTCIAFGSLGFIDDFKKVKYKDPNGLSAKIKLLFQVMIGLSIGYLLHHFGFDTNLNVPFVKQLNLDLGYWYIGFSALVIVASSNAVNLTDGLDGLAIGPIMIVATTFLIFSYVSGHTNISAYLMIPYVPGSGELSVVCAAIVGSGLGFLWYNTYPAQVFMGDVGSLSLGALIGFIAVTTKNEILLILCGAIFVIEATSVMIQVFTFKVFKRRMFRMAPIHHHFELKGWAEPKIIVRFWIISIIMALLALSSLKLR